MGLLQGTLDLLVIRLSSACWRPVALHGCAISRRPGELSGEWFAIGEGSLYPCLYRIEKKGWIRSTEGRSENNRRARFHSLTGSGSKQLEAEHENWRRSRLRLAASCGGHDRCVRCSKRSKSGCGCGLACGRNAGSTSSRPRQAAALLSAVATA